MSGLFDINDFYEMVEGHSEKKRVAPLTNKNQKKEKRVYKTIDPNEVVKIKKVIRNIEGYDDFKAEDYQYSLNVYDFEVVMYDWCVTIINPINKTKTILANDRDALISYYENHKNEIWCGFNSRRYDVFILKSILLGLNPKEVNDLIILDDVNGWDVDSRFRDINLLDYDVMKDKGLKKLEGFMGHDIRECEIPFDIDRPLTRDELLKVLSYNIYDVEQTIEVFRLEKSDFDSHIQLIDIFDLPIKNISKTQAGLAPVILKAKLPRDIDRNEDAWDIRLPKTRIIDKYHQIEDWFLNPKNHNVKAFCETDIFGVPHNFAWGGIHGAKLKYIHKCSDDEVMVIADVSQLYPFLMYEYKLLSRNCPRESYDIVKNTIDISIKLKELGKKKEREPYKRFNNIIYGAEGASDNKLYDPLHRRLVCVYGQILILDLIEKLSVCSELIQSNTDGVLFKLKKSEYDRFIAIVNEWERRTKLSMTFDKCKEIYQSSVNNYILVDENNKVKRKGTFVKKSSELDCDLAIVNEAVVNYLVYDKPIEDTINQCTDLRLFQKIVVVNRKHYTCAYHNNKPLNEKTIRLFASRDNRDTFVGRCKIGGTTVEKFANTPDCAFIYNGDVNGLPIPDKLDLSWYVKLAEQRISEFFGVKIEKDLLF